MPIPRPRSGESRSQFVSRCVSAISDEYEGDQAVAICIDAWGSKKELHTLNLPREQLDWYWKTIERKRVSFERGTHKTFNNAFMQQFEQFDDPSVSSIQLYQRGIDNISADPIEDAFDRVYQDVASRFAQQTYKGFKVKGLNIKQEEDEEEEDEDLAFLFFNAIKDFVSVTLIEIINSMNETTRGDINHILQSNLQYLNQGGISTVSDSEYSASSGDLETISVPRTRTPDPDETIPTSSGGSRGSVNVRGDNINIGSVGGRISIRQFSQLMKEQYKMIANARATTTSRTETVRASNVGLLLGARATNIPLRKVWVTMEDSRVRPTLDYPNYNHRAAHGQRQLLNNPFEVTGEMLQYPADPAGSAGNTINCRCALAFETI